MYTDVFHSFIYSKKKKRDVLQRLSFFERRESSDSYSVSELLNKYKFGTLDCALGYVKFWNFFIEFINIICFVSRSFIIYPRMIFLFEWIYIEGGQRGRYSKHGGYPLCVYCSLFSVNKLGMRCMTCTPDSKVAKRAKKEEEALTEMLLEAGFVFQREQHIHYSCFTSRDQKKFARLDFLIECKDKRVILECDEHQHKNQSYPIEPFSTRLI